MSGVFVFECGVGEGRVVMSLQERPELNAQGPWTLSVDHSLRDWAGATHARWTHNDHQPCDSAESGIADRGAQDEGRINGRARLPITLRYGTTPTLATASQHRAALFHPREPI